MDASSKPIKLSDYIEMLKKIEQQHGGDAEVVVWYDDYKLTADPSRYTPEGVNYYGEEYAASVSVFN